MERYCREWPESTTGLLCCSETLVPVNWGYICPKTGAGPSIGSGPMSMFNLRSNSPSSPGSCPACRSSASSMLMSSFYLKSAPNWCQSAIPRNRIRIVLLYTTAKPSLNRRPYRTDKWSELEEGKTKFEWCEITEHLNTILYSTKKMGCKARE